MKRGIGGTHHHAVSAKYLNKYVWRYKHRDKFDGPAQYALLLFRAARG